MTQGERVGWHHQLNGHGFEQTPGVGDGQGSHQLHRPHFIVAAQSLSHVQLFASPWTAAHQALLSSTLMGVCSS